MSLMDVAEPERTLSEVTRVLRAGGFVQFSVLHPVISAPIGRWVDDESGARQARAVGDYFYQGLLTERWAFNNAPAQLRDRHQPFTITYARRTLAGWLSAVLASGLAIEAIAEPCADEETAAANPQVADTRIAPYFLTRGAGWDLGGVAGPPVGGLAPRRFAMCWPDEGGTVGRPAGHYHARRARWRQQ